MKAISTTKTSVPSVIEIDRKSARLRNIIFPKLRSRYSQSAALLLALNYFPTQVEAGTITPATRPSAAENSVWTSVDANALSSGSRDPNTADGHGDGHVHSGKSGNFTNRGWARIDAKAFTSGSRDSSTAGGHSDGHVRPRMNRSATERVGTGVDANAFTSGSRDPRTADGHSDGHVHPRIGRTETP
jgi:hypothetical protein